MGIERKMFRDAFLPTEVVELRQPCFTFGQIFQPGRYRAADLPDLAFEMGLVDHLPQGIAPRGDQETLPNPDPKP
jgi:hypothetical protein